MKTLILGPTANDTYGEAQLFPLLHYSAELKKQLGMDIEHVHVDRFCDVNRYLDERSAATPSPQVVFVRTFWDDDPAQAAPTLQRVRETFPDARIYYIDGFDQTSSRFFDIIPFVDKYFKNITFRDPQNYERELAGGTMLTHKLNKELGIDLKGFDVVAKLTPEHAQRIDTWWYYIPKELFRKLVISKWPWHLYRWMPKSIGVFCHASCGKRDDMEWYGVHRKMVVDALEACEGRFSMSVAAEFAGEGRISHREYVRRMFASRIAFGCFGWGEATLRPYEAMLYNCLLVQPDISYLYTEPDIFEVGETYVGVEWDCSDIGEKCEQYLNDPTESRRLIANLRNRYLDGISADRFVSKLKALFDEPRPVYG